MLMSAHVRTIGAGRSHSRVAVPFGGLYEALRRDVRINIGNQLVHDVSTGKAAPRFDIVRRMSATPILQTDREHEIVATSTVHRPTPQS